MVPSAGFFTTSVKDGIPKNDYYIAYITATSTNVYSAELKITIENNHCRYGELIFY